MNMQQIRKKAKAMQIAPGSRDKTTLIRAIQEQEGNIPCFRTDIVDCDQLACCWRSVCLPNCAVIVLNPVIDRNRPADSPLRINGLA